MSRPAGAPGAFWSGERAAGLVLEAIAAIVALAARPLPLGSLGQPGPGYAPLLYAAILAALGLAMVARGGAARAAAIDWGDLPHALVILGAVAFAALAIERLGYRLTMLAVLVFLLGAVERRNPLAVALVAFDLSFGSHFVFWTLLRVPLPSGPFGI